MSLHGWRRSCDEQVIDAGAGYKYTHSKESKWLRKKAQSTDRQCGSWKDGFERRWVQKVFLRDNTGAGEPVCRPWEGQAERV